MWTQAAKTLWISRSSVTPFVVVAIVSRVAMVAAIMITVRRRGPMHVHGRAVDTDSASIGRRAMRRRCRVIVIVLAVHDHGRWRVHRVSPVHDRFVIDVFGSRGAAAAYGCSQKRNCRGHSP